TRGAQRDHIDGLVLDSPGVDWPGLLTHNGSDKRVPRLITRLGISLIGRGLIASGERGGIDFTSLRPEYCAERLRVPVLIQVGGADRVVPWEGALELERLRPELVQVRKEPSAGHVRIWNVDRAAWERSVHAFVAALPRPAWRG